MSIGSRCLNFFLMPVQLVSEDLTSETVVFTMRAMISGSDFRCRSGNVDTVETHRSGYNVPWHEDSAASWICSRTRLFLGECRGFVNGADVLGLLMRDSRDKRAKKKNSKRVGSSLIFGRGKFIFWEIRESLRVFGLRSEVV